MSRISETRRGSRTLLRVEGRLAGPYVRVLEGCCARAFEKAPYLEVRLRDVCAIDDAARDPLRRLVRRGVWLRASGLYLSNLVRSIRRSAVQPETSGCASDPVEGFAGRGE